MSQVHNRTVTEPGWSFPLAPLPAPVEAKLSRFARYQEGWAGNGKAFPESVLSKARGLLSAGLARGRFRAADVFPGRRGQIIATLYGARELYDFELVATDEVQISREIDGEEEQIGPLTLDYATVVGVLLGAGPNLWDLFCFLSKMTTHRKREDSKAVPSSPTATWKESRFSMRLAGWIEAEASVPMLGVGTGRQFQTTRLYTTSGDATPRRSLLGTAWNRPSARLEMRVIETSAG